METTKIQSTNQPDVQVMQPKKVQTKQLTKQTTPMSIHNPSDVMKFANTLKQFIVKNKLSCEIQGKQYVYVDGWKFAGVNFGLVPMAKKPVNESKEGETKYSCECDLVRMNDNVVIGYGFALCSNKEFKKKNFDEYAIASMAQTRAIAKAFRNLLGFVMNEAGFESTPADEMDEKYSAKGTPDEDFSEVIDNVKLMNTVQELLKYYEQDSLKQHHSNDAFNKIFHDRKIEIVKPVKK